jgi:hypothetical protein
MKMIFYFRESVSMKIALSISLILVFTFAQYGIILSYVYCKWKSEIKATTCDCEKKLVTDTKNSDHSAQLILKDKSQDPYIKTDLIHINKFSNQMNSCFVNNISLLAQGFESSVLRPPAIV